MNLLDTVVQFLTQSQLFLDARLWQEIKAVNNLMLAADTVYAPKTLNETNRIPVQIIVDDLIAILHIQPFGQHIGSDQRVQLGLTGKELILRIGAWGKPANSAYLAFVTAINDIDIFIASPVAQILIQVTRGIGILREDQPFTVFKRSLCEALFQSLQFRILLRRDRLDQGQDILQLHNIVFEMLSQALYIKISYLVATGNGAQSGQQIACVIVIRLIQEIG